MALISVPGRLGKNAIIKDVNGMAVVEFSVAETVFKNRMKDKQWYDCQWWGNQGVNLAPHLTKGKPVTVEGNMTTREYNGKTYLDIKVFRVTPQGSGEDSRRQEGNSGHDDRTTADELDDALAF